MSLTRTLSSLRHACTLGLTAELLVPQFMAILDQAVPADVHSFVWHGPELQPLKIYTDASEVSSRTKDVQAFLANLNLTGDEWLEVKEAALAGRPHPLLTKIFGFFADEIRRPLGLMHEEVRFLPAAAGQTGSLYLWRGGNKGYSRSELEFLKSACGYLSYGLATPPGNERQPMVEEGPTGVVLLDPRGTLLQADDVSSYLLPQAVDAPYGAGYHEDASLATLWLHLCNSLTRFGEGRGAPPPQASVRNSWGEFAFRASWLQRPGAGATGVVAVTITLRVPRKVRLWRAIGNLGLSPRQQEVALLFAEGRSQNEIAAELNIARTTVIDHIRRLYDRLGIPPDRDALRAHLLDDSLSEVPRLLS